MRRIACELSRYRALHALAVLFTDELAGQRRCAAFDADAGAIGLARALMLRSSTTTSAEELRQTAPTATSAEKLAEVKTLSGCLTR